jgi:sulfur carrier protein ThiS
MKITVHLHTILQRQTPEGLVNRLEVSLPPNYTLEDLLQFLEIDLDPDALLLAVNGRMAELNQTLQEGDKVNLMPAISGGGRMDYNRSSFDHSTPLPLNYY